MIKELSDSGDWLILL